MTQWPRNDKKSQQGGLSHPQQLKNIKGIKVCIELISIVTVVKSVLLHVL